MQDIIEVKRQRRSLMTTEAKLFGFQRKNLLIRTTILTVIFGLLTSCASTPPLDVRPIPVSSNPSEEVKKLEKAIGDAKRNEVDIFSPNLFEAAQSSLAEAKTIQKEGGKVSVIFETLALGNAQITKASELAKVSATTLASVTAEREKALKAGANKNTQGFTQAEALYNELNVAVEAGELGWVQDSKDRLISNYKDVELNAIRDRAMKQTRAELKKAEELDTEDLAEKAYGEALAMRDKAVKFINSNRYDIEGIEDEAKNALFFAKRANHIARYAKYVDDHSPEEVALWIESNLKSVSSALSADLRDRSFADQFKLIGTDVVDLRGKKENLDGRSRQLASQLTDLQKRSMAQYQELTNERNFHRKFLKARTNFSDKEAEVYKEGGRLVIRLKGITFPSGKAILLSQNYPLLSKVKSTLEEFSDAKVVVEGHTDSVGSAPVNKSISSKRAKSVSEYLVANNAVKKERIVSKGLGFSKPIATNKTKEGRALNRRIDIIIEPTRSPAQE